MKNRTNRPVPIDAPNGSLVNGEERNVGNAERAHCIEFGEKDGVFEI